MPSQYDLKKKSIGSILSTKTINTEDNITIQRKPITDILIYVDNKNTEINVFLDEFSIQFTPKELNDFPINASDFQKPIELVPMLVMYNDIDDVYIVILHVNSMISDGIVIIRPPSGLSIRYSVQINYIEMTGVRIIKEGVNE